MAFYRTEQSVEPAGQRLNAQEATSMCPEGPCSDPRRLLGAYYTPDALASVLATWALAPGRGNVLDPSFGGGAFLNAATTVLANKSVLEPGRRVFGVDVDPGCMKYVHNGGNLIVKNCIVRDFLSLSPKDMIGAPFHAVIGNPPYVRHHWLDGTTREAGRAAIAAAGVKLPATASAWAYFLIHALSFLAKSGRLAMLVPEAILQADYAAVVRDLLASRFSHVCLVHIRDRLFKGTDEAVVTVAASDYGKRGSLRVETVERADDVAAALNTPKGKYAAFPLTTEKGRRIDPAIVQLLSELEHHSAIRKVSDVATVRIGLVTGANTHFIRNVEYLRQLRVPRKARLPLVSRTRWLSGLDFTEQDLQTLVNAGQRAILVRPTPADENAPGIQRWITEGIEAGVHDRFKCTIRNPWFRVALLPAPDAFATCTRMGAPLLVLNQVGCRCTNALHAVYWHRRINISARAIAGGFLTSAVGIWAELHGRRYGGGVLKIEPGTLKRIPVPIVRGVADAFGELNALLRNGREGEARALADDLVLRDALGLPTKDIRRLQRSHEQLMAYRRPARNGNGHG